MPKTNTTAAAASDDEVILGVFERLALEAGREVMRVFHEGCAVDRKSDSSPVTEADRESEKIILAGLRAAYPAIPCVAEEEVAAGIATPDLDGVFFLIDPLDGTKEFVNRRTDFTVNIALIRHGVPEVGVVFAPCTGRFFSGRPGRAEAIEVDGEFRITGRRPIAVRAGGTPLAVVASRSHNTPETDAFIRDLGAAEIVSVGSSLKFCLVAAAEADVYPRFGRTMEWDTAAGDAVLRAAGGMTRTLDGQPLAYGKRNQASDADFANPHFIASGKAAKAV
ncbi:3'(2'),5'-bisphosphate nucleotidase [Mesorhizobium sp. M4B.F.Ca.ET.215.01.1.1]|nr:3'(2'),5'-bisphosphate nucleotidase [Mesorhizobium sp. M4B.F.Ca.ET.019.03.1.1]TGQ13315.1 3'(2'),5'-bisphosphate nucleotidase [Mesorhizobium sp. M4B.F.Ca.ET.215.01.1.1]TGQ43629.1 3'(2'),5'-bisphosphate nucleotidase [Mesorhizobium sp. M4B.F.Ca.ET.214.01.1.1]TGQ46067.1 3'(2'),5'-bisphosphate nucleotidase [Mesorhizobium sp. M00.F.Ca.ET.220.01.1.1]TGQ62445.1 3'(2'),5'-bisphosphate nucleotidase [Mesorhizobium sp. M4B.F.Ca.ET.211.01.1.1]TGR06526.1 3'(2'),5'-bisphosphate nucleotidase [Mesorhizobium